MSGDIRKTVLGFCVSCSIALSIVGGCSLQGLGGAVRPSDAGAGAGDGGSVEAGRAPPEVFVTKQVGLGGVALNDEWLVWTTGEAIRGCRKQGCNDAPTTMTDQISPNGYLAATPDTIAYALQPNSSGGGVRRCQLPDCSGDVGTMYELGTVGDLAVDGDETFLLHTAKNRIVRCNEYPSCAQTPIVVASGVPVQGRIALDAIHVYWTSPAPDNAVYRCLRSGVPAGEAVTPLVRGQASPRAIAVDSKSVYWANFDDGTVRACSLPDCAGGPREVAKGQGGPSSLALDTQRIYWTNQASNTVMACPLDGCNEPAVIATDIATPISMTLDATHLYVLSRASQSIYRIQK